MPSSIAPPSAAEPAFHHSNAAMPAKPVSATSQALGSVASRSRRSTRSADTRRSDSTGGAPNASSTTMPTPRPCNAGNHPAGGIDNDKLRSSQPPTNHCNPNAIPTPSALANTPSSSISPTWIPTSVRWLAPRQRITAAPDRWRSLCRRAAIATATAASTTDTSAARSRKRPARSSAERISGRASPMVSSRCPRPSAGWTVLTKRSTALASPAMTRR